MELFSSEETLLKDSAAGFMSEHAPVQALRDIRDHKVALGFNQQLHKTLADMAGSACSCRKTLADTTSGTALLGLWLRRWAAT